MAFFCVKHAILIYTLPQKKRKFNVPIFPGAPGFLTLIQVMSILSNALDSNLQKTFVLKLNGAHSSQKERQLQKSCVSFGEECTYHFSDEELNFQLLKVLNIHL